ncbi:unnamed protein product [Calicophoron daubneyi]|uniref:Uncharacterized protein n=1 Tax=Calicophoron daubneyi TaxID=300641 RepID=A0AAV2TKU4_CALDB
MSTTKVKEDLESKNNAMELEVYRKEAHVSILQEKYNQLEKKLKNNLLSHDKLADDLKRELITIRGEREIAVREGMEKDAQIADLKDDLNRHKSSLAAADNQLDLLRAKLENEILRSSELEKALVEKRAEMVQINATLRQLELQFRDEVTRVNSVPNPEAQEKMERLQRQLTDSFLNSENDRFVREKQAQEIALLTQENAKLSRENVALRSEAETARSTLNRAEGRHNKELAELNGLRQREKDLLQSNITLRQNLEIQDKRCKQLEKQLEKQEKFYDDMLRDPLKQRNPTASIDTLQMQKDKQMLLDHISEMQREIARQGQALDALKRSQSLGSPRVTGHLQTNSNSARSTTPLPRSQNAPYSEQTPAPTSNQQPITGQENTFQRNPLSPPYPVSLPYPVPPSANHPPQANSTQSGGTSFTQQPSGYNPGQTSAGRSDTSRRDAYPPPPYPIPQPAGLPTQPNSISSTNTSTQQTRHRSNSGHSVRFEANNRPDFDHPNSTAASRSSTPYPVPLPTTNASPNAYVASPRDSQQTPGLLQTTSPMGNSQSNPGYPTAMDQSSWSPPYPTGTNYMATRPGSGNGAPRPTLRAKTPPKPVSGREAGPVSWQPPYPNSSESNQTGQLMVVARPITPQPQDRRYDAQPPQIGRNNPLGRRSREK